MDNLALARARESTRPTLSVGPDWEDLLAQTSEPPPIIAERHVDGPIAQSFSRPHVYLVNGDDGEEYVVKFRRSDQLRTVTSEQVVGRAGWAMGAAVGFVAAIEIAKDL